MSTLASTALGAFGLCGCHERGLPLGQHIAPFEDRSFWQGRLVQDASDLSGIWEAPDGHGGAVGLHLQLSTSVSATETALAGVPQSWEALQVGIYERAGRELALGETNWISDSPRGGGVVYGDDRLRASLPGLDLDLHRGPDDTWSGRLHRQAFDQVVTLRRPRVVPRSAREWFLGTWRNGEPYFPNCLHLGRLLGREADGAWVAWTDSLQRLGCVRYVNGLSRPARGYQGYGALASLTPQGPDRVSLTLGVESGACCPVTISATRRGRDEMRDDIEAQRGASALRGNWYRLHGQSCSEAKVEEMRPGRSTEDPR